LKKYIPWLIASVLAVAAILAIAGAGNATASNLPKPNPDNFYQLMFTAQPQLKPAVQTNPKSVLYLLTVRNNSKTVQSAEVCVDPGPVLSGASDHLFIDKDLSEGIGIPIKCWNTGKVLPGTAKNLAVSYYATFTVETVDQYGNPNGTEDVPVGDYGYQPSFLMLDKKHQKQAWASGASGTSFGSPGDMK